MEDSGDRAFVEKTDRGIAITQAQAAVRRLLQYSVGRVRVQIPGDLIADCVTVMWISASALSADQEATLWKCLDRLSQAVSPATAASVEQVEEIEQYRQSGHRSFLRPWREPEGPRFITRARKTMLIVLLFAIVGQIYTLSLASVLSSLSKYHQELQDTKREISSVRQANPNLEENAEPLHGLIERSTTTERRIEGGYQMLMRWSVPWRWLVMKVSKNPSPEQGASTDSIIEETAQAVLQSLTLYLLPVLYGLLGAAAYILRRLNESLEQATFTIIAAFRYRLRLALGALLGPTIGLFFTPETKLIPGATLSLVAMAFLAGYSVEVVFALLDSLIDRARDAFGSAKKTLSTGPQPSSVSPGVKTESTRGPDQSLVPGAAIETGAVGQPQGDNREAA